MLRNTTVLSLQIAIYFLPWFVNLLLNYRFASVPWNERALIAPFQLKADSNASSLFSVFDVDVLSVDHAFVFLGIAVGIGSRSRCPCAGSAS
jgi:hypothetical protein